MITFILGVIAGIMLCIFYLIADIWFVRNTKLRRIIEKYIPNESGIIEPKNSRQLTIDEIVKENEKRGRDTYIDEIYRV